VTKSFRGFFLCPPPDPCFFIRETNECACHASDLARIRMPLIDLKPNTSKPKPKTKTKPIVMKPIHLSILALAAGSAFAAEVYTPVVGYITHTINAQGGELTQTIVGPSLVQPTEFAGNSVSSPSGNAISFAAGVPTGLEGSYVLEITSGPSEGWWSTVVSSTSDSITVNDEFPAGLASDTAVSVRKHNTIQTFLGENVANLIPFNGEAGDEIQILNPDQSLTPIAYVPAELTGGVEGQWYNLATAEIANDLVIEPGAAVIVKTTSSSPLSFVSVGQVKTTATQFDVHPGLTLVAQTDAAGATFNEMNLQFSLIPLNAEGSNTDYDEFQILNSDQSITPYAAVDPALLGVATLANLVDASDAGDTVLPGGTGAIIKRDSENGPSTITIPGSLIAE